MTISALIEQLHKSLLLHQYPNYLEALRNEGIHYANNVTEQDPLFFIDAVGMKWGSVTGLVKLAKKKVKEIKYWSQFPKPSVKKEVKAEIKAEKE
jgi:Ni,Fe-hydrogenase maturation factor